MKTLLTTKQQKDWLLANQSTLQHQWSTRGWGSSKIRLGPTNKNKVIGKATGCGYDRFGTALGNTIEALFPAELQRLARRTCKGRGPRKGSTDFYGLFMSSDGIPYLDGGCGHDCMTKVLNKIGFSLKYVGETSAANHGVVFYTLLPVTKSDKCWL